MKFGGYSKAKELQKFRILTRVELLYSVSLALCMSGFSLFVSGRQYLKQVWKFKFWICLSSTKLTWWMLPLPMLHLLQINFTEMHGWCFLRCITWFENKLEHSSNFVWSYIKDCWTKHDALMHLFIWFMFLSLSIHLLDSLLFLFEHSSYHGILFLCRLMTFTGLLFQKI